MRRIRIGTDYTPALDITSKSTIWILLILCEVVIGLVSTALPPLYLLILVVVTPCVIWSLSRPYLSYVFLLFSLPFFAYSITGTQEEKGQIDIKFYDIATIIAIFSWIVNGLVKRPFRLKNLRLFYHSSSYMLGCSFPIMVL